MTLSDEEFAKQRKKLLEEMLKKVDPQKVVTKVIPFTNDDVPKFCKMLEQVYKQSAKSELRTNEYSLALPYYK